MSRLGRSIFQYWPPALMLVLVLGVWEIVGRALDPLLFAPPSRTAEAFWDMVSSGQLGSALLTTLSYLIPGFILSAITGIVIGVLMGRSETWGKLLEPYINAVYATPRVVIIPLVILWFGVGYNGRIFIIWLGAAIPIIISTAVGVRYVSTELIEAARSFQATERQLIRHVILPGAVPFVASGFKIGAERALVGAVIAEVFLSLTGVGGIIQTEAERLNTPAVLAGAFVYAALGWLVMSGLGFVEKKFAVWKSS